MRFPRCGSVKAALPSRLRAFSRVLVDLPVDTCIAAGSSLGASMSVLREWMLVLQDSTVDSYAKAEANFEAGPVTQDLVGFLVDLV